MAKEGSFAGDLRFLQQYDSGLVVLRQNEAAIVVSPRYQAKVFTSTARGDNGAGFGWINYKNACGRESGGEGGGENQLCLGLEGGQDTGAWEMTHRCADSVTLQKGVELTSHKGTALTTCIRRRIKLLGSKSIDSLLLLEPDANVKAMGYRTENVLTNTGAQAWTESTGMPCIRILDMFKPSPSTTIVIPYKEDGRNGRPATTDYFGEIPAARIKYEKGVLFFKADGESRGRLGIYPSRATNIAGSYDPAQAVLTIILFDIDPLGRYLGNAVYACNDGPLADGTQTDPFYELQSVSPAALLSRGHSLTHWHSVFHFVGSPKALDRISRRLLHVSLSTIKTAL